MVSVVGVADEKIVGAELVYNVDIAFDPVFVKVLGYDGLVALLKSSHDHKKYVERWKVPMPACLCGSDVLHKSKC